MEGASFNDSIFSMLDHSWFSQPIGKHSCVASGVQETSSCTESSTSPGVESDRGSEIVLRSSEEDSARTTASGSTECSTLQSVDDHRHQRMTSSGIEFGQHSMDESEMRRVFDRFDSNGDGFISGEELHRYLKCCGTDLSDAEADSMLSRVDVNNDGSVGFEEFFLLYHTYCSEDASEEDDERSRDDEEQHLLDVFHVFDRNDDGFISAQELQAVLLNLGMPEGKSLNSCEAMIRVVDRDGDGQCDIREFQEMMAGQSF